MSPKPRAGGSRSSSSPIPSPARTRTGWNRPAPVAVVVYGGWLALFQTEFGVLGAPFLASGYDGIRKVVTSDMFEGWVKALHDNSGRQVLSFNWWQGKRHLMTRKEIKTPADLAGVRMRTPGAPVWTGTIAAMGATPTPMPWGPWPRTDPMIRGRRPPARPRIPLQGPCPPVTRMMEKLEFVAGTVLLAVITVLVFIAAVMRFFGHPLIWSVDLAQLLFIWLCFIGASRAMRQRLHLGVDFLVALLSRRNRLLVETALTLVYVLFLATLAWEGTSSPC